MEGFSSISLFAANGSGAQLLFLGLLLATTASLLFRSHRRLARSADVDRSGLPTISPIAGRNARDHDRVATMASQMEVRLHDSLREAQGRLDTKIAALNQLIVDADRESARLEALIERLKAGTSTDSNSSVPDPSYIGASAGKNGHLEAGALGRVSPFDNPDHKKIYALADAGLDAPGIARRVGSGLGEVELILGLRNKAC